MATTKNKPAVKKTVPKTKPTATQRTTKKSVKKSEPSSFKQSSEATPFMTFKPTIQTVYWLILGIVVIALGAWVMYLNGKVQDIYDQIDMNTTMLDTVIEKPVQKAD